MAGATDPDLWQLPKWLGIDLEADRTARSRRFRRRHLLTQRDHDLLAYLRTGPDLDWIRQRQRCAIGLERCIGPVALILHFEHFAAKTYVEPGALPYLVADGAHVQEWLVGSDQA